MRSVTLSCITFQWMSTRAHWSFQAVRGQTFSPLIFELVISTSTCPERGASMWASIVAKPIIVLFAKRPICLRLPSLSLYRIYHQLHQQREEVTQSHSLRQT